MAIYGYVIARGNIRGPFYLRTHVDLDRSGPRESMLYRRLLGSFFFGAAYDGSTMRNVVDGAVLESGSCGTPIL